jgi:peptidoglycan/LPS O-acetylase OafA/YrhL
LLVIPLVSLHNLPLYLLHNNVGLLVLGKLKELMAPFGALLLVVAICIASAVLVFKIIEPAVLVFFKRGWEIFEKWFTHILNPSR